MQGSTSYMNALICCRFFEPRLPRPDETDERKQESSHNNHLQRYIQYHDDQVLVAVPIVCIFKPVQHFKNGTRVIKMPDNTPAHDADTIHFGDWQDNFGEENPEKDKAGDQRQDGNELIHTQGF
jgi:hypothetical protein